VEQLPSAARASNGNGRSHAGEGWRQADAPQRTGGSEPRIASWTWHAGVFDSSGRLTVNPKCGGTTYADT
jgi:hypothetical protein